MEGKMLHIQLWDDSRQDLGFFGGVSCEWQHEDGEFTDVDPDVRQVNLVPKKCGMFTHATRELVEDADGISSIIGPKLAFAIAQTVDEAVLVGDGVGKPLGFINSNSCITVSRATAGLIDYEDVIGLYASIHPAFLGNSIFLANPECASQLLTMQDPTNAYIWIPGPATGAATAVPTTLLGRPLIWTDKLPGLAEEGCLAIADLSMYAYAEKRGIIVESSNAPGWQRDRISWRAIIRADGTSLLADPITPRNGSNQLSAFAKLSA
jgi:HK97 family phage major capsid protein